MGRELLHLFSFTGSIKGNILDYGCGPGYLIEHILAWPHISCSAIDSSAKSVRIVNERFSQRKGWKRAVHVEQLPVPFGDDSFDLITCIETLEHVTDDFLRPLLAELHRLVRPGGRILFTTPNNEDLARGQVYCPFCNAEFHGVQHLRSFTEQSLSNLLSENGFEVIFCRGLNLREFTINRMRLKDWSLSMLYQYFKRQLIRFSYGIRNRSFPAEYLLEKPYYLAEHLCAVVTCRE